MSPDALLNKAFRIRRFGRAELHKCYIRTQVQMKTDGLLNAFNKNGGRSLSQDNLPTPQVVDNITANSATLTYKAVSYFCYSFLFPTIILRVFSKTKFTRCGRGLLELAKKRGASPKIGDKNGNVMEKALRWIFLGGGGSFLPSPLNSNNPEVCWWWRWQRHVQ